MIYEGKRTPDGVVVTYRYENGTKAQTKPKPLRHVNLHSPDGFEWGYGGSGPADLALSILAYQLGEHWVNGDYLKRMKFTQKAPMCWTFHQDFKRDVVGKFQRDSWALTSKQITDWLVEQPENQI